MIEKHILSVKRSALRASLCACTAKTSTPAVLRGWETLPAVACARALSRSKLLSCFSLMGGEGKTPLLADLQTKRSSACNLLEKETLRSRTRKRSLPGSWQGKLADRLNARFRGGRSPDSSRALNAWLLFFPRGEQGKKYRKSRGVNAPLQQSGARFRVSRTLERDTLNSSRTFIVRL